MVFKLMFKSWTTTVSLILGLLMGLFVLVFSQRLPAKVPLFYSLPWGENQLVDREQLLILPATIILITLFNLIVSWQLHTSQIFFKKILNLTSVLISIILTITFIKIVYIFL